MAAQSPTEQTISKRCRRLRQLIDMYFRALEWVIHHDNSWQLGKAEKRFCLNRQKLKILGINTVADINDEPDWTQSVENVMWDKKSVDETGLLYRSDLQSKTHQDELEQLPDNAVVTMITFKPNPNHIPIWEILGTMQRAFCGIEKDIQETGVQWSESPSFQYCENAQDLLDYVKAKSQQPKEILKDLETERKKCTQLAITVSRRSAQFSHEPSSQTGTEPGDQSADAGGQTDNEPEIIEIDLSLFYEGPKKLLKDLILTPEGVAGSSQDAKNLREALRNNKGDEYEKVATHISKLRGCKFISVDTKKITLKVKK